MDQYLPFWPEQVTAAFRAAERDPQIVRSIRQLVAAQMGFNPSLLPFSVNDVEALIGLLFYNEVE
jgi:hypothetical protein